MTNLKTYVKKAEKEFPSWFQWQKNPKKRGKEQPIWEEMFPKAKNMIERMGKTPSLNSKDPVEKEVARWCACQRNNYRFGALSPQQKNQLESINHWGWNEADRKKREAENDRRQRRETHVSVLSLFMDSFVSKHKEMDDEWQECFDQLNYFIKMKSRGPRIFSEDRFKGLEKQVVDWSINQLESYLVCDLPVERCLLLSSCKDWIWHQPVFNQTGLRNGHPYEFNTISELVSEISCRARYLSKYGVNDIIMRWCNNISDYKHAGLSTSLVEDVFHSYPKRFEDLYSIQYDFFEDIEKEFNDIPKL